MKKKKKNKRYSAGGNATLKKYGRKHFSKLAKMAWKKRKDNEKKTNPQKTKR
jgi:hypothetical protein